MASHFSGSAARKVKRFPEIGDRLRAYRMGAGITIDEAARRLGVSRAAVYRYEQGEVVKIETIERLGRLLRVPLTALLGADIEFISSGLTFFERIRQLEEQAQSMVVVYGPVAYVLTSDEYDTVLRKALAETFAESWGSVETRLDQLMECLTRRKTSFRERRVGLVSVIALRDVERFLSTGLVARTNVPPEVSRERRAHALREVMHIADMLSHPPMGVQIGLVMEGLPVSGFQIIRQPDRTLIVTSPFRVGDLPNVQVGVASINDMGHVVQMHEAMANELWANTLTGEAAAEQLRQLCRSADASSQAASLPPGR